jgi:hypothetical protein
MGPFLRALVERSGRYPPPTLLHLKPLSVDEDAVAGDDDGEAQ